MVGKIEKNKKGFLQIPFSWIFAIIVGIFILFLAIYFAYKMISSGQQEIGAETARQIDVLLNPLETSFETSTPLILSSETRIYNKCENTGTFGEQIIQISQKSFNKWAEPSVDIGFENKYLFSDDVVEGEKFYLFSVPFEYPFKIANLIILTSKEYCFLDAPDEIENDIIQENVKFETNENNCEDESVKVCFSSGNNCDIEVNIGQGYVDTLKGTPNGVQEPAKQASKDGEKLYFTGNLIYGAIFSSKEIYECEVNRLMKRTGQLASLYWDKSSFVRQKSCNSNLDTDLLSLRNSVNEVKTSEDLSSANLIVEQINNKYDFEECVLW